MDLPTGFLARRRQNRGEIMPIQVVQENDFTPIPSAHDMVMRVGIFHSDFSRHANTGRPTRRRRESQTMQMLGGDRFTTDLTNPLSNSSSSKVFCGNFPVQSPIRPAIKRGETEGGRLGKSYRKAVSLPPLCWA
jgi:hypothetical protein